MALLEEHDKDDFLKQMDAEDDEYNKEFTEEEKEEIRQQWNVDIQEIDKMLSRDRMLVSVIFTINTDVDDNNTFNTQTLRDYVIKETMEHKHYNDCQIKSIHVQQTLPERKQS